MLNNGLQLQYPHLGLPFIGIGCSNMIKVAINMFNAIYTCIFCILYIGTCWHYVSGRWVGGWVDR